MQAQLFYTETSQTVTILVPIAQTDVEMLVHAEKNWLNQQQFSGKCGEIAQLYDEKGCCKKVFLGTGDNNIVLAMAIAATKLLPGSYQLAQSIPDLALTQWALAQYRFDFFKKQTLKPRVLVLEKNVQERILPEIQAVFLVRDLINQPANKLGPEALSATVKNLAQTFDATFKEWIGETLREEFPAIHAVGKAAEEAPRLLTLTWGEKTHPLVALVGKGVCFDSGGLDVKNSGGMRLMKKDMGGAAQVLGLAQWIMAKKLPVRLAVYIPAVENAIGSRAYRPGDVITMRNGLTVEVDNTDAEGRLVLADALSLACEQNPEVLFDFSTLTGAARTAVGTEIAAMFTNDEKVALELAQSSAETGDMIWRMPLYTPYASMLDSTIADLSNCSPSPYAGAILAALFLQRFVKSGLPWIHFDIMAWNIGNKPGRPEGGEAMGIRAVADYLFKRYG